MRNPTWIAAVALAVLAACGSSTSPQNSSDGSGGGGVSGGGGGGGGGGGPVGEVIVGNNFFRSAHNGGQNAAVDTIAAGGSVTWRWNAAGSHSIESARTPNFASSAIMSAANSSYTVTFNTPGSYAYQCGVHGMAMTGRIVVQ